MRCKENTASRLREILIQLCLKYEFMPLRELREVASQAFLSWKEDTGNRTKIIALQMFLRIVAYLQLKGVGVST